MTISIPFPEQCKLKVKAGDTVDFSHPFYVSSSKEQIRLAISDRLNVPPKKIFQYLKKFVGDTVEKGDIIAKHSSFFSTKLFRSENSGIIREIRHQDGTIILDSTAHDELTIQCFFVGEVTHIEKSTITLKVSQGKEFPLKQTTGNFGGKKLVQNENHPLHAEEIHDRVICAETIASYDAVKYDALDCRGIICAHTIESDDIQTPIAYLKKIDDWKALQSHTFSYCLVTTSPDTLYLYS